MHTNRGDSASMTFDLRAPMWGIHHALAWVPRRPAGSQEERLRRVEEELAVMDVLARYTYFYDGGDVDGVLSVFHDDCVLINPRGTYVGKEAIRRNYTFLMSLSKVVLHFATNVAVRVADDATQAWMTAYYYSMAATPAGRLVATGGTYADRLVKVGADWKIIERRITYNVRHTAVPEPPGATPVPPAPTRPESSRDIVGPAAEM